jgi:hypothetical protein
MSSFRITKESEKIPKQTMSDYIDENKVLGEIDNGIRITLSKIDDSVICSWKEIANSLKVENTGMIYIQLPLEYTPLDGEFRFLVPGKYLNHNHIYAEIGPGYIMFMPNVGMVFVQEDEVTIYAGSVGYHL